MYKVQGCNILDGGNAFALNRTDNVIVLWPGTTTTDKKTVIMKPGNMAGLISKRLNGYQKTEPSV